MALKSHIDGDAHAALPEAVQSEYVAGDDGSFVLQVEGVNGYALDNVAGLRDSLAGERKLTGELKQKLKGTEGLDLDAARAALAKVEEMKDWKPDAKVEEMVKSKTTALETKYTKELADMKARGDGYYKQLERALVDGDATAALAKHRGNVAVLLPHMRTRAKLVEVDGNLQTRYIDDKGNELLTRKPNSTDYMGAEEFVETILMKDENFMPNFAGVDASGFGSKGSERGGSGQQGGTVTISGEDAKDSVKYRNARQAAAKAGKRLVIV